MILTDFLLARIAEDEEIAELAADAYGGHQGVTAFRPKRLLAECEAKRAIVSDLARYCWVAVCVNNTCERVGCRSLRALALPYAAHRDYMPEWAI